jgi:uncharacterized membrane protein YsdA (DUF1294 family)
MTLLNLYLLLLAGVSIVTFTLWGIDKAAAVSGNWRIPERTLLGLTLLGGAAGAGLGMVLFHHKTRKPPFKGVIIAALITQIVVTIFLGK